MADLIEGLKNQFPSLSDEDAVKASALISNQHPIDPSNDTAIPASTPMAQPMAAPAPSIPAQPDPTPMEPKFEPEPAQDPAQVRSQMVRDYLMNKADPNVMANLQQKYNSSMNPDWRDTLSTILSLTPRGSKYSGLPVMGKTRDAANAKFGLQQGMEAAKMLQAQDLADRTFNEIDRPKAIREQTDFDRAQMLKAKMDDPLTDESKLSRETAIAVLNRANLPKVAESVLNANGGKGASRTQIEDFLIKKGSAWQNAYDQEMQNQRARMVDNRARELHEDAVAAREDTRKSKEIETYRKDFQTDMDSFKGRTGAFGKTQETLNSIARAKGLLQQFEDGDLPPAQVAELTEAWQRAISGGSGSEERIKRLLPASAKGDVNKFIGYMINTPKGAGQQEFIKLISDSLDREEKINSDIIKSAQVQRAMGPRYKGYRENYPDEYKASLMQLGIDSGKDIDEHGRYTGGQKSVGGLDRTENLQTFKSARDMKDGEVGFVNGHKVKRIGDGVEILQ